MRGLLCTSLVVICSILNPQPQPLGKHFVVATIRPAQENSITNPTLRKLMSSRKPGEIPKINDHRIRLHGWSLLDLVCAAYKLPVVQVTGPTWLNEARFDIDAVIPENSAKADLNVMLQSLLAERFGLRTHSSVKNVDGYLLTQKGRLVIKLADAPPSPFPQEKSSQDQDVIQLQLDSVRRTLSNASSGSPIEVVSWPSITFQELALQLTRFAKAPVVDGTGLQGEYSVTLEIPGEEGKADIVGAVEKLGLKLERRKLSVESLTVDEVSRLPTAN